MSLRDSFKSSKSFRSSKSVTILAKWCNGSTTDSGSVCLGSSPSLATIEKWVVETHFLLLYISVAVDN